jgi:transglutaminase-like putative cysteine protease
MKNEIDRPSPKLLFLLVPALISSAVTGGTHITAIPCLFLIIASYFIPFYFKRNSFKSTLACLGIFGASLVIHLFLVTDLPTGNGPHVMAASMIVLMVYLWYYQNPRMTSGIIILLSLLVLIFTGNNLDNGQSYYPAIIILFTACLAMFLISGSKKLLTGINIVISLLAIPLIILLSFAFNKTLFIAENEINNLLQDNSVFEPKASSVGLSSQFSIESHVKLKTSQKAVMLLESAKKANYLRADVMVDYAARNWKTDERGFRDPVKFDLDSKPVSGFDQQSVRALRALKSGKMSFGRLELLEKSSFLPLPPYTRAFSGEGLRVKPFYTVENKSGLDDFDFYGVAADTVPAGKIDAGQTRVAADIAGQLKPLALSIVKRAAGNLAKAKLIESYFHNNYSYSLEVNFDPAKEPVVDFVLNKKKGFCAHFASGMVLMLRSIGVPAHIVSGYLVSEFSPALGRYIVRERDAHAWVEVYDEKNRQWATFDATPVNQMIAYLGPQSSFSDDFSLYTKLYWLKVKMFFSGLPGALNKVIFSPVFYIFALFILAFYGYKKYRERARLKKSPEEKDINIEILVKAINKLLEKNKISFAPTMTYGELLNEIDNSENIPGPMKHTFTEILGNYQKYRYSSQRSPEDFQRIEAMLRENLLVLK